VLLKYHGYAALRPALAEVKKEKGRSRALGFPHLDFCCRCRANAKGLARIYRSAKLSQQCSRVPCGIACRWSRGRGACSEMPGAARRREGIRSVGCRGSRQPGTHSRRISALLHHNYTGLVAGVNRLQMVCSQSRVAENTRILDSSARDSRRVEDRV